jgi:hypothetical protein
MIVSFAPTEAIRNSGWLVRCRKDARRAREDGLKPTLNDSCDHGERDGDNH